MPKKKQDEYIDNEEDDPDYEPCGKKKKSDNFTSVENNAIMSVYDRHQNIINDDRSSQQEKRNVYLKMQECVNACAVNKHSLQQVTRRFYNIKKSTNKKMSDAKRTGGGPPENFENCEQVFFNSIRGTATEKGIDGVIETGEKSAVEVINDCTQQAMADVEKRKKLNIMTQFLMSSQTQIQDPIPNEGDIADETVQSDVICAFPVETSTQIDDQPNVRRSAIENISQIEASNSGQFLNVPESDHGRQFVVRGEGLPPLIVTANSSADTGEINKQVSSMLSTMIPENQTNFDNITGISGDMSDIDVTGILDSQQLFTDTQQNSTLRSSTPIQHVEDNGDLSRNMITDLNVFQSCENRQIDYFQRVYGFKLTNEMMTELGNQIDLLPLSIGEELLLALRETNISKRRKELKRLCGFDTPSSAAVLIFHIVSAHDEFTREVQSYYPEKMNFRNDTEKLQWNTHIFDKIARSMYRVDSFIEAIKQMAEKDANYKSTLELFTELRKPKNQRNRKVVAPRPKKGTTQKSSKDQTSQRGVTGHGNINGQSRVSDVQQDRNGNNNNDQQQESNTNHQDNEEGGEEFQDISDGEEHAINNGREEEGIPELNERDLHGLLPDEQVEIRRLYEEYRILRPNERRKKLTKFWGEYRVRMRLLTFLKLDISRSEKQTKYISNQESRMRKWHEKNISKISLINIQKEEVTQKKDHDKIKHDMEISVLKLQEQKLKLEVRALKDQMGESLRVDFNSPERDDTGATPKNIKNNNQKQSVDPDLTVDENHDD